MDSPPSPIEEPLPIGSPFEFRPGPEAPPAESDLQAALQSGEVGFLHSFTTGSALDGPGMRLVAWLSGCQFRCVYCHNPDTWKLSRGTPIRLSRAVEVLRQYRHDLHIMKGGVTLSGGEPLVQHRFVLRLFALAQDMGVHTTLDTNGYLGDRLGDGDLARADLVMLDLKAMSPELHKRLTGMDPAPVHAFARRLAAAGRPVWVRFVLVPGWTDDMKEVERVAAFAAELGNVQRVDVLPFHQMGRFKWERLGMDYPLRDAAPPSRAATEAAIARFRAAGLKAF